MAELEAMASYQKNGEQAIFTVNGFNALQETLRDEVKVCILPWNMFSQNLYLPGSDMGVGDWLVMLTKCQLC